MLVPVLVYGVGVDVDVVVVVVDTVFVVVDDVPCVCFRFFFFVFRHTGQAYLDALLRVEEGPEDGHVLPPHQAEGARHPVHR